MRRNVGECLILFRTYILRLGVPTLGGISLIIQKNKLFILHIKYTFFGDCVSLRRSSISFTRLND
jgi:hypothetical protein